MERRLAAILAADVVGYSRLMAGDEAGTLAALKSLRHDIFDPKSTQHRGRVVKLMGDGTLMEFASVVDAANFAIDVQQAMAARNSNTPGDQRIDLRIGINLGDVIIDGDDLYGDGINIAARLEALADPGGICISSTVHDQVKGKIQADFEDLGTRQVKNIPDPVRVFRIVPGAATAARPVPAARAASPARWRAAAVVLFLLVAAAGLALWQRPWEHRQQPASESRMAFPLPDKPSIAVLPFDDLSDDASQQYFTDGMTEDLITDLSKISGLFVIARNSSFAYKGNAVPVHRVAEELGVRYVLEGSVRRAGDQLRVNAQLIDATTGGHVWADRFDGRATDIFAVQDQFVRQIVVALELKLSAQEETEISKGGTGNVAAMEAFQRGWELYSRFNEQDNARSVSHFERAVELDPQYGRAYGALALVYLRGSLFQWDRAMGEQEANLRGVIAPQYLQKARENGSELVHVVNAMQYLFNRLGQWPGQLAGAPGNRVSEADGPNRGVDAARREAGLAIALQPSDPEAHIMMAWALIAAGKPQEGLNFVQAAKRLNPNYPSHYVFFDAAARFGMGDLEQAATILRAGMERDPHAIELAPMAASIFVQLGERREAKRAAAVWRPGMNLADLRFAIEHYHFPIIWENESNWLNTRLLDGLRLAALPLDVTVESLRTGLDRQPPPEQFTAIQTLGWFGPAAAPAVPELTAALGSEDKLVRKAAVIALGKIGPAAAPAVPALTAMTEEPITGFHAKAAIVRITGE